MKKVYVTTSWDDGAVQDRKLSRLLDKYGLKGTFYCLLHNDDFALLDTKDIFDIAERHEIGTHTLSHCDLTKLSEERIKEEILVSKQRWYEITKREITMFSYPFGQYNEKVVTILKSLGFKGARIVRWLYCGVPKDPFRLSPSAHAYPHSRLINIGHLIKHYDSKGVKRYLLMDGITNKWEKIAMNIFDYIHQEGGVWHLWGHSWEIDKFQLWREIEMVFEYISNRKDIIYCSNGELVDCFFRLLS
jgi:peptidoglycan/xylan/chitin deacetylase (PgdA/CDA1 family)